MQYLWESIEQQKIDKEASNYSYSKLKLMICVQEDKQFICVECGKPFATFEYLEKHLVEHSEETPFFCDYPGCQYKYKKRKNIQRHKKLHAEGFVPYICNYQGCGQWFQRKQSLYKHNRSHYKKQNAAIKKEFAQVEKIKECE